MLGMPRRIDTLTLAAEAMTQPLADSPATEFLGAAQILEHRLQIDYDHITEYMRDYGLEKSDLAQLLVSVHPHGTLPGTSRNARACLYTAPQIHNERVYYPHIALGVAVAKPNSTDMNDSLRHELRHIIQENSWLPYHQKRWLYSVQATGVVALAGAALAGVEASASHQTALYVMGGGAALLGAISVASPDALLSYFSPQEAEARQFAREHQAFAPISLVL